ncbi:uncharacterized protein LOC116290330 isoform X2 [Actinia tenebrosa]|uniref:Uncharacterized protein LOC116290330 isoform X2 n=1 Tax=Actinia tenebrosa TaxID=6105 RepID=A0A6P8HC47_ACTTE|nr:uncharacterized protein LOC116290330 isoform X2 [Actinia tenebrosa]
MGSWDAKEVTFEAFILENYFKGTFEDRKTVSSSCSSLTLTSTTENKPDHSPTNPRPTGSRVQFLNLHQVYQKVQSRVGRESKQRLVDARVRMVVTFDAQIEGIQIFVERVPEAAALLGDNTGRVELEPRMGDLVLNKQYLSVDLDSVYLSPQGMPVYKLSTVDAEKRNRFRIVVVIKFIDGTKSKPYFSRPFLIRSRRSSRQDSS